MDDGILRSREHEEIMPFAGTSMDLKMIRPSEVSQTKEKYHALLLVCGN